MKKLSTIFLLSFALTWVVGACSSGTDAFDANHTLYYNAPAQIWEETLPLGNGRLGMMPDGGTEREHIVLNEISLWSGSESDYCNPDAAKSLPEIRSLLFEGRNREAQALMFSSFVPKKQESDGRYGSYQTLGSLDIVLNHDSTTHYRRWLDLQEGVAYTTYQYQGVNYRREYFVSHTGDVMLVHLTADKPRTLSFTATLNRGERATLTVEGQQLVLSGQLDSGNPNQPGMRYRAAMRLLAAAGNVTLTADEGFRFDGGHDVWLVVSATTNYQAAGTDFPGERYITLCDSLLQAPLPTKEAHMLAHQQRYDRVSLSLPTTPDDQLPTDERLLAFQQQPSPSLAALYYNYGRYLLISSTRPGSLPPNLQGLWADGLWAPWNGDYHTNINIQMNHWPLEQAGLGELYQPLTTLVERLVPSGEESAKCFYGADAEGWVLHMMTNVWNYTAPGEHPLWGATNTGGAWLCAHLWEHYLYTGDTDYLQRIYPLLKGASRFFLSTMVTEPQHGWIVTAPTSSPENCFYVEGDRNRVSVCMGPTMDVQLLTELYQNVIQASHILGVDEAYADSLQSALQHFPPMQISDKGYLQEWLEDYEEDDPQHRHVSHLYGLHPANLITPYATPELAEACRQTLERRGDGGTGWSRAWKINFWARLGDGNRAWLLFRSLLQPAIDGETGRHVSGTYPNLFCAHPPFQIDGNFGGAAGVGEMLLQSHAGFIEVLPALPDDWHEGSFRGMRVRGGAAIDLAWSKGKVTTLTLTALNDGTFVLKMPRGIRSARISGIGQAYTTTDNFINLTLKKGEKADLVFND
ncbi:MAG: glycoside hydrolase family 95 protein [Bacteroides sp.]|nr:glycoside hydrolase family 95 protein [Bacteroides sp.]